MQNDRADELERLRLDDSEAELGLESPSTNETLEPRTTSGLDSKLQGEKDGDQRRQNRILVLLSIVTFVITFFTARSSASFVAREDERHDPLRTFSPHKEDSVILHFDDSMRYDLNTEVGAAEWAALVPEGDKYASGRGDDGHLVWLWPDAKEHDDGDENGEPEAFTVSLFHQLKCLDVIRQEYVSPVPLRSKSSSSSSPVNSTSSSDSYDWTPSDLTQHCMNYLRQTILCRPNLQLESVKRLYIQMTSRQYDVVCEDWEAVYEEAGRNRMAWDE